MIQFYRGIFFRQPPATLRLYYTGSFQIPDVSTLSDKEENDKCNQESGQAAACVTGCWAERIRISTSRFTASRRRRWGACSGHWARSPPSGRALASLVCATAAWTSPCPAPSAPSALGIRILRAGWTRPFMGVRTSPHQNARTLPTIMRGGTTSERGTSSPSAQLQQPQNGRSRAEAKDTRPRKASLMRDLPQPRCAATEARRPRAQRRKSV